MEDHSLADLADAAVRQLQGAVSKIDLQGIASSVGRAVGGVAQAFGVGRREPSPYIVVERDVDKKVQHQYIRAAILLVVTFVFVGSMLDANSLGTGAVLLLLSVLHARWGIRHVLRGRNERRLAEVLQAMAETLGDSERVSMARLAQLVEVPTKELEPLVREAIDRGLLPEGRLDRSSGSETLYLTAAAWEADLALRGARQDAEAAESRGGRGAGEGPSEGWADNTSRGDAALPEDATQVAVACDAFVRRAYGFGTRIANREVSESVRSISSRAADIGAYVRRHPDVAPQLRKLRTYYLPTTSKLVASYTELEGQTQDANTAATMAEIRDTLRLIDEALARLSTSLRQSQSWDLRSDMDVMRQMIDQDGLSGEEPSAGRR